ncbi:MAG TPA: iron-containing alcohol dehydrogenase, partial [Candidatus Deferrimicrobium sp.]|nr:iron-containing alcohol dehydrogenase [Candidatus Deferrimicrobium sp.]
DRLPDVVRSVRRAGPIVVIGDHVPILCAGVELKPLVTEMLRPLGMVRDVRVGAPGIELHADAGAVEAATRACDGAGCVVAVGSGTVCDVSKEASRTAGSPFVVVQTACSVNAFSDDMAVLLVNGVKRTVPSRWPDAMTADLRVLGGAPAAMNRAGVGELLAMFTAPADWRLAAAVGMDDTFDPRVVGLYRAGASALIDAAPKTTSGDPSALRVLTELMTLSGLAMGVAGRTAPVSGTEHTVSHLLDMAAARSDRKTGLHGAQVGVAALSVAVAWDRLLDRLDPACLLEGIGSDPDAAHRRIDGAFAQLDPTGVMAAECWAQYSRKLDRWRAQVPAVRAFVADWDRHHAELRALLGSPPVIARALRAAGAPARFEELDPPAARATAAWALLNGHLIRDRFTLADLAWFAGAWTPEFIDEVIDAADTLAQAG